MNTLRSFIPHLMKWCSLYASAHLSPPLFLYAQGSLRARDGEVLRLMRQLEASQEAQEEVEQRWGRKGSY